jgi:hypothetical protein
VVGLLDVVPRAHERRARRLQRRGVADDVQAHAVLHGLGSVTGLTQMSGPAPAGSWIGTGQDGSRGSAEGRRT